ncbi:uncharacterized protein YagA-like [Eriocheir sinensis]|uniref:uncharacterized protein YagA-like n=1 Tax=Eriocheir sinensis TaxID=95602 RepID=UPI0021C7D282|nr:uncharacterized protein YagA-like [Eriocheir sinensis]
MCRQCFPVRHHTVSPPAAFTPRSSRLEHVHVDLVGPLPHSNGYKYLLTCVDRFTRWPEAVPVEDITTDTIARAFVNTWVSRFGTPLSLTSDRGSQFESNLWDKVMSILGVKRIRTASYHPQSNGLVERFHRQLKASLAATVKDRSDWTTTLPLALLGIRTTRKNITIDRHGKSDVIAIDRVKPAYLLRPDPPPTNTVSVSLTPGVWG